MPRITRTGVESSATLGRYRWRVERSFSWLLNYRRPAIRWERTATNVTGFLALAAALTCYKNIPK
nr:transposase [Actinopolyspora halophila]